jgi:hypothetical protein
MARWILAHNGEYVREVTTDTTHLICTIEDFKKRTAQVKKAWALGSKCNIVVKDWLEDCLIAKPKRVRAVKGYSLPRVIKRGKQAIKNQIKYRQSFEDGVRTSYEFVDNRIFPSYLFFSPPNIMVP